METQGKILVVDDELGIREGCRRVLAPEGFSVAMASTMSEGRRLLDEDHFDLVLLDVMMPDGRGLDLLATIQDLDPDIVPIVITGYATVELAVEAIKAGAYDFISKPFTADLLLMTVRQGLEKRRLTLETRRLQAIEQEAAEMARAKAEAERLQELQTAFTYQVAHELRAPVAASLSLLRTMNRGLAGQLNETQADILGRIENRLNLLMELVNDLLSLAASKTVAQDEPLERVALKPLIGQVVDQLAIEAEGKGIRLTLNAPETPMAVQATEEGLRRIFSNLVGNAIKYTPAGGQVEVTARTGTGWATLVVTDSGMGIPVEDLDHVWEEFFRARNVRRSGITGTGLGLSIVKQLVTRYGGSIEVQSVEGQGTTFTVRLPLDDDVNGRQPRPATRRKEASL
jgi:signal transduction histidine kinase